MDEFEVNKEGQGSITSNLRGGEARTLATEDTNLCKDQCHLPLIPKVDLDICPCSQHGESYPQKL